MLQDNLYGNVQMKKSVWESAQQKQAGWRGNANLPVSAQGLCCYLNTRLCSAIGSEDALTRALAGAVDDVLPSVCAIC